MLLLLGRLSSFDLNAARHLNPLTKVALQSWIRPLKNDPNETIRTIDQTNTQSIPPASIGRRSHYLDTFYTRQDCYYFTFNINILSYKKSQTTLVCAPWLSSENEAGPSNRYFRKKCESHLLSGIGNRDRPNRMDSSKGRKFIGRWSTPLQGGQMGRFDRPLNKRGARPD